MKQNDKSAEIRYFSGYIRNWEALCGELGINPALSRAERENAILVDAYLKWGLEMTSHIFGMFAFSVWDEKEGKLYVVRDQVGQKQMFYTVSGGELIYSGDINEIAEDPRFEKKINLRMLQQYLFYGYPIGEETFYEGLYKLLPGHYLEWDGKSAVTHRYFRPEFKPDNSLSAEDCAAEIRRVVDEILGEESRDAEVPYKESFLSGGVDSSYLFAASDAKAANTVGYEESGFDESALAKRTAEILGKPLSVKMIRAEEYFDRIPVTIDKLGQPLGDASAVAFSIGCAAVKEHADVVYSGEGIDEFFGGYNAHKRHIPDDWVYLTCSHIMSGDVVRSIMLDYNPSVKAEEPVKAIWDEVREYDELSRKLAVDISLWLEGDIYFNTDRTSTACGIELHTPFSDLRLFNAASKIPEEYHFVGEQNKYAFRLAASDKLPEEVAFRKKVGFPVPVRNWLRDERFTPRIAAKLFSDTSKRFFNQDELSDWWNRFLEGEEVLWNRIYAVYVFILWYDTKLK